MHLKHLENALLIDAVEDEKLVIAQAIQHIHWILGHRDLLPPLTERAYAYAAKTFDKKRFQEIYRRFLVDRDASGGRLKK